MKRTLTRRNFLRLSGLSAAAAAIAACTPALSGAATYGNPPLSGTKATSPPTATPVNTPTRAQTSSQADVALALQATPATVAIFPGRPTQVWQFRGQVQQGDPAVLQPVPNSYLGPTIRVQKGQRLKITFSHDLPQESIVHWHGLHVPAEMDGHPRYTINRGETYEYEFDILNRAGTYWYHPHPHGITGPQVYAGMAGFFIVHDEEEQALGLPSGAFDIPLVIQDRVFDGNNQLVYRPNGMMDQMMGFLGDQILVNGQPDFTRSVEPTTHRLRILNGSNSRIYKLAWPDGTPFTVIGTDGGLLDAPVQRPYLTLGPAERVDLLVDFSRWAGQTLTLRSLSFSGGGFMGGGMSTLPNGASFDVMRFQISEDVATPMPYKTFVPLMTGPVAQARGAGRAWVQADRVFQLYMQFGQWTINGRTFQMEAVAPDETVKLGTEEVWEFVNQQPNGGEGGGGGGGMGGGMPHPMHIHGLQFQIVGRQPPTNAQQRANWETVKDGYVDEGWKDTVLLMAGERVQVRLRFEDFTGLYLYHCHNLEHEDMGMMRNYKIVA